MLVTLFLVLINIFNTVRSNAPSQSSTSLNAVDMYIVGSIIMVFFALSEYAVVLFSMNRQDGAEIARKKRGLRDAITSLNRQPNYVNGGEICAEDMRHVIQEINCSVFTAKPTRALLNQDAYKVGPISVRKVDLIALIFSPLLFVLFNVVYWLHFINVEANELNKNGNSP